jgi:hypothetical protein
MDKSSTPKTREKAKVDAAATARGENGEAIT